MIDQGFVGPQRVISEQFKSSLNIGLHRIVVSNVVERRFELLRDTER
jgi:hypothetical protein